MKVGGLLDKPQDAFNLVDPENIEDEYDFVLETQDSSGDETHADSGDSHGQKKPKEKILQKQYILVEQVFPDSLIKAQGKSRGYWDFLIILLSVYQAIAIPLSISFNPDIFGHPVVKTVDSLIDLIFALDIIFRFRTTYIDPISGEEILDNYLISKHYVTSSSFYFDVISTIPFDDFISNDGIFPFLGLFKLIRVWRIGNVVSNLNQSQEFKAGLKVLNLIFYMFLYIHIMGCIWNYSVNIEEQWIPNMDFIWFSNP